MLETRRNTGTLIQVLSDDQIQNILYYYFNSACHDCLIDSSMQSREHPLRNERYFQSYKREMRNKSCQD